MSAFVRAATAVALLALGACAGAGFSDLLTPEDDSALAAAVQAALEANRTGEGVPWHVDATGHGGTVTPTRTFTDDDGRPCRDYQMLVTAGDATRASYATACRAEGGQWVDRRAPTPWREPGERVPPYPHATFGFGLGYGHGYWAWPYGPYDWRGDFYGPYWGW